MRKVVFTRIGLILPSLALVSGCAQKKMSMEEMMQPPPRPAELDLLNDFVGTWDETGESRMAGSDQVSTMKGSSTMSWDCDKRVLIGRFEGTMEGQTMQGIAIWTWDADAGRFKSFWFDSFGAANAGTATYDENSKTWHFKGKGNMGGQATVMEGTARMVDKNTMEWSHTEWNCWRTQKLMDMKGTSRRK